MSDEPARAFERLPERDDPQRLPRPHEQGDGYFVVDARWGVVQPVQLAPGVETLGELEVIDHIRAGRPIVDTRLAEYVTDGMLPGAVNVPHTQTLGNPDAFDPSKRTVVYCNGPQCQATQDTVTTLLDAGQPAESLLYYRGGIHDWVTLGYSLDPVA